VDAELAELMAKAGCTQVSLGFESGSDTMLPQLDKRFTCIEVREISGILAGVGIQRYGFLLFGGPGETRETVEESLEFADSLHLDTLKITVGLRIYPQTPLASGALKDGLITPMTTCFSHAFISARRCGTGSQSAWRVGSLSRRLRMAAWKLSPKNLRDLVTHYSSLMFKSGW
jgi:hypothetical protein